MLTHLLALMLVQAPTLENGATVRVAAPQVAPAPIVGRVEIADQEGVWIAPSGGGASVRVPWSDVTGLQVRHRRDGVAIGFIAGAIVGGLVTTNILEREIRRDKGPQIAAAVKGELKGVLWGTIGGAAGGLLGAAIGSRFRSDRWEAVHVGITPVALSPQGLGLGAGVQIAF